MSPNNPLLKLPFVWNLYSKSMEFNNYPTSPFDRKAYDWGFTWKGTLEFTPSDYVWNRSCISIRCVSNSGQPFDGIRLEMELWHFMQQVCNLEKGQLSGIFHFVKPGPRIWVNCVQ